MCVFPRASRGFIFLFIAIDTFTKWMEAMLVVNITQEVAVKFLQSIIYRFSIPKWVLTDNRTQFKGAKFVRCCADFGIHLQLLSVAHPQTNGLVLQGMKIRLFHDLEARGQNWHKELPLVLWALRTNIKRATRDTPFNLVYGADVVLPPKIYLESARVAYFNTENQAEVRELDSNLLEEMCNTLLANVWKYQDSMKRYYNKSVVQRELDIRDLVLKKDICTKDKHKFSSS
jgi:transposase InsO family protein